MLDFTILENGALQISANEYAREELLEALLSDRGYWSIMGEAFETESSNGSFTHFDAGQGDPFVGLTSAPCIAESMDYLDSGERKIDGRLWYFSDYQIRCDLRELITRGQVEYQAA